MKTVGRGSALNYIQQEKNETGIRRKSEEKEAASEIETDGKTEMEKIFEKIENLRIESTMSDNKIFNSSSNICKN